MIDSIERNAKIFNNIQTKSSVNSNLRYLNNIKYEEY